MSISDESVQEFKVIFRKEYNKELTDEEARECGENLLRVYKALLDMDRKQKKEDSTNQ